MVTTNCLLVNTRENDMSTFELLVILCEITLAVAIIHTFTEKMIPEKVGCNIILGVFMSVLVIAVITTSVVYSPNTALMYSGVIAIIISIVSAAIMVVFGWLTEILRGVFGRFFARFNREKSVRMDQTPE